MSTLKEAVLFLLERYRSQLKSRTIFDGNYDPDSGKTLDNVMDEFIVQSDRLIEAIKKGE